ncbi:hypothetical protein ACSBR1_024540 [Camellia fascicularis]
MMFLQETKCSSVDNHLVNSLWPSSCFDFIAVDVSGTLLPNFECIFVNIYAPNDPTLKKQLWGELINLKSSFDLPWCLGGDFNEVLRTGERKSYTTISSSIDHFKDLLVRLELRDIPMLGRSFIWSNNQEAVRWSRIDRFLLNPEWLDKFNIKQWGLERTLSDHCPILLIEDDGDWGPKPFKFLNG